MAESLNFYGRQFIKQGRLWLKFGVILHHWTVIWFFIENKVRICWFQLRNLHKIIFIRTKIIMKSLYLSWQTVCWSRWPMTNFWRSTLSKAMKKTKNFTIISGLVRDQIKKLTIYRFNFKHKNSSLKIHVVGPRHHQSMSPLIYQGHLVRRVSVWSWFFKYFTSGRRGDFKVRLFLPMTVIFSKAGPIVGCMPIFFSSLATA